MKNWDLELSSLEICDDVWIAANCVVLPSCSRIGKGGSDSGGSIVTTNAPDYAVVAGIPSKVISYRD